MTLVITFSAKSKNSNLDLMSCFGWVFFCVCVCGRVFFGGDTFVVQNARCQVWFSAERPTAALSNPHLSSKAAKRRASRMFSSGSQVLYLCHDMEEQRCALPNSERIARRRGVRRFRRSGPAAWAANYRLRSGHWRMVNPAIAKKLLWTFWHPGGPRLRHARSPAAHKPPGTP